LFLFFLENITVAKKKHESAGIFFLEKPLGLVILTAPRVVDFKIFSRKPILEETEASVSYAIGLKCLKPNRLESLVGASLLENKNEHFSRKAKRKGE